MLVDDEAIRQKVAAQFAPNAAAYATSPTHSNPDALARLVELVKPTASDLVLDVATGAGHVALAFAPQVKSAVAFDLTPTMLEQVREAAEARGLTNIETVEGKAEAMQFGDASFDLVTVRVAPHHFADVTSFVQESFRVLKPRGRFLVVDTAVPEDEELDREINRIELLRDPSHVRNYRPSEWRGMLVDAGFRIDFEELGMHSGGKWMEMNAWMDRIGTPAENRPLVTEAFAAASSELEGALDLERTGDEVWFSLPELTMLATKTADQPM